jgi:hypothetical protein
MDLFFGFIMVLPLAGANFNRELEFTMDICWKMICGSFSTS